jgi:hypothetical protein
MTDPAHVDPTTPHQHALALAACGLRVLPIKPGRKHPPMNSWQHAATNETRSIDNWFNGLYRDCGVGLALGPQPSGLYLFAIDIDTHDPTADGWEALHDLEAANGELPNTWRSLTGAGGGHLIFAAPPGVTVRNQQAAGNRIAPGIDVRGDGGQIVVAPTTHPDTGIPYAWEHNFAPWEQTVAAAPDWLIELVADAPAPASLPTPRLPQSDIGTVFDLHRADWTWETELLNRGWTICGNRGDDTYWARPGKDRRAGHSAVLHGTDGPLVIFTTEIPSQWTAAGSRTADGSGWSFGPFGFYAALEHNGDRSTAAAALNARYGLTDGIDGLVAPVAEAEDAPEQTDAGDWTRHDIVNLARRINSGEYKAELPEYLAVEGGLPLLYPGRVHTIFGEPSGGKTWIALAAIAERLRNDDSVLMIDWEDSPQGTIARLLQLGCDEDDLSLLDYRNPVTGLKRGWDALEVGNVPWALVVIDSTGEAMAASGIDPNADGPVAEWMALAKRLARTGAAVLLLDHVPKNVDNRDMEIGSQRKQAAITGASYRCDTITSPARGKDGKLKLVVRKDRLGTRPKGATAAEVHFIDGTPLRIELRVSDAQIAAERGEKWRPTVLMERVSKWLEYNPGASRREIEKAVTGNGPTLRLAIDVLIEEGWIVVDRSGKAHEHRVVRDYRESEDELRLLVDNPPTTVSRPTASNRVQTASLDAINTPALTASTASPCITKHGTRDAVGSLEDASTASPVDKELTFEDVFGDGS